jgi:hypothetical protein
MSESRNGSASLLELFPSRSCEQVHPVVHDKGLSILNRIRQVIQQRKFARLDTESGGDLAEEVRKYHLPDFSNWKNHDAFEHAFARLEKDLRTSIL